MSTGIRLMRAAALATFTALSASCYHSTELAATWHEPDGQLWSASTAERMDDPIEPLATAIMVGVRWRELVLNLHAAGATKFVESGPGHVLAGLVRKTIGTDGIEAHDIADLEAEAAAA